MFVNRGKVGPVVTQGEAEVGANGKVGTRMNLIDEGDNHRVVSTSAATFSPIHS
jgi:hypothetical protein